MAPAPKRTVLLHVNLILCHGKKDRERWGRRARKEERKREGGREGGKKEKEGVKERKREGERREGGRKEREKERKKERTFQAGCVHTKDCLISCSSLAWMITSVQWCLHKKGEFGFSWLPRSYHGTEKEGLNMGSFLAQVRISGNGDSFKYLFHKRLWMWEPMWNFFFLSNISLEISLVPRVENQRR